MKKCFARRARGIFVRELAPSSAVGWLNKHERDTIHDYLEKELEEQYAQKKELNDFFDLLRKAAREEVKKVIAIADAGTPIEEQYEKQEFQFLIATAGRDDKPNGCQPDFMDMGDHIQLAELLGVAVPDSVRLHDDQFDPENFEKIKQDVVDAGEFVRNTLKSIEGKLDLVLAASK